VPRIIIHGPDGQLVDSVELGLKGKALVGRAPNPSTLGRSSEDPAPQLVPVSAQSVSTNHLLAWAEDGTIVIEDLKSRNGTWLLLPGGVPIRTGRADVALQLARSLADVAAAEAPPQPSWTDPAHFAQAIATTLRQWPPLRQLDFEVSVLPASHGALPPSAIPLASGQAINISPRATSDGSWNALLERLWRWIAQLNALYSAEEKTRDEGMILASDAIRATHREVLTAARGQTRTLLLCGPSGAGKEMLADAFHRHTGRNGPFVAVNCALFTKELLRSELFGAEAGSFTGASRRIVGAVERANGGTLFLDEIGDLPEEMQPMLLRFLDRWEYETLGQYGKTRRADVCIVAATNRDLREAVRKGSFRSDLWFRLSVNVIDVPALCQRWEDILGYLGNARSERGAPSLLERLSPAALSLLRAHAWDGNFRELANFRERLSREPGAGPIDVEVCRTALERGSLAPSVTQPASPEGSHGADWAKLAARATRAFVEDRGRAPADWDEQKEWNEKYLKPLVFHAMAAPLPEASPGESDDALTALASRVARRLRADRGTALKQLTRYYERFGT